MIAFEIIGNVRIDVHDLIYFFRILRRNRKHDKDGETCRMK